MNLLTNEHSKLDLEWKASRETKYYSQGNGEVQKVLLVSQAIWVLRAKYHCVIISWTIWATPDKCIDMQKKAGIHCRYIKK